MKLFTQVSNWIFNKQKRILSVHVYINGCWASMTKHMGILGGSDNDKMSIILMFCG